MADVEIAERNRLSPFARGPLMGISGEIDGSVHGRLSLTVSRTEAGRWMFYPITSRAARQRKGELGAFGRIDAAASLGQRAPFRAVNRATSRAIRLSETTL